MPPWYYSSVIIMDEKFVLVPAGEFAAFKQWQDAQARAAASPAPGTSAELTPVVLVGRSVSEVMRSDRRQG